MATSMSDPVGQQLATSVIPAAVQESDWRKRLPVIGGARRHPARVAGRRRAGVARVARDERGRPVHFAAADDGRRVRALHFMGAAGTRDRPLHLLRGRARGHVERRSGSSRFGSSNRSSAPPSGVSRSAAPSGARESSRLGEARRRLRVRDRRRPSSGSACRGRERARQRRAREDRRGEGGSACAGASCGTGSSRPGALVDRAGRLAAGESSVGGVGALIRKLFDPPPAKQAGPHKRRQLTTSAKRRKVCKGQIRCSSDGLTVHGGRSCRSRA